MRLFGGVAAFFGPLCTPDLGLGRIRAIVEMRTYAIAVWATAFRAEVDMGAVEVCGGRFGASPKGLLSEPRSGEPGRSPEGANFASREAASLYDHP